MLLLLLSGDSTSVTSVTPTPPCSKTKRDFLENESDLLSCEEDERCLSLCVFIALQFRCVCEKKINKSAHF